MCFVYLHPAQDHGPASFVPSTGSSSRGEIAMLPVGPAIVSRESTAPSLGAFHFHVHISIIAITAHVMTGDADKCLQASMDGYVSKPIRTELLSSEIERLTRSKRIQKGGTMEKVQNPSRGPSLNLPELLERVDNDRELLRDLLSIFKEKFPRHLHALQEAVTRQDAKEVTLVSHMLKGMLSNLAVNRAAASAGHLEQVARDGADASLQDAFAAFEKEVQGLLPEMETYMVEVQP